MFSVLLLSWWYGRGWGWLASVILDKIDTILQMFSVVVLIKTFFSPWKQIQSPTSLRNFLQSSIDNLISRFVGAGVRFIMLLTAMVSLFFVCTFGLLSLILWPVIPTLIIILPVVSFMRIS